MKKTSFFLVFSILSIVITHAQIAKNQVLALSVEVTQDGFNLQWPVNNQRTGTYLVFYRDLKTSASTFQTAGPNKTGPAQSYTFNTKLNYVEFLVQYVNSNNQLESIGYIAAGNKYVAPFLKGRAILLVDSLISLEAVSQLNTLKKDLLASGWFYDELVVKRSENTDNIKQKIQNVLKAQTFKTNALYIIGHVPVPYSGYFSASGTRPPPDGHIEGSGNHTGAWPADVFYADFEGIWEDMLVSCVTGTETRHHNIGGDGKYDASELPGNATLDLGRVDFHNMPAFAESEVELTRNYLNRAHEWKLGNISYTSRALIDNNFGSLNLASTGYHNFSCFLPQDSIFEDRDYFTAQNTGNYLWSYGCGAGSYTSCNGIGNTADFVKNKNTFNNIFTILAGSYFGDWDSRNNLLRAALASGSLATFWGGIPKWYVHHMALGKHIGQGARISQNNNTEYFNGGFNASHRGVHIALLGDPTLQMIPVKPIRNLSAISNSDGSVSLKWSASVDATEYEVVRIDLKNRIITPVSREGDCAAILTDTMFTDKCNWSTGDYMYGVLAANYSKTASGTFLNRSLLQTVEVSHVNNLSKPNPIVYQVYPNPTNGIVHIKGLDLSWGSWSVYDLSGRKTGHNPHCDLQKGIDLSTLNNGLYRILVTETGSYKSIESWVIVSQ